MMEMGGPCGPYANLIHVAIVVIQSIQAVGVAYMVQRAARKNREDRNGHSARHR